MIEVFSRRNASNVLPVMWVIGELGLAYERHDIGGSFGRTREPWYLAMNPNARIPTIKDGDFVLWESNAIVRYICRGYDNSFLLLPESEQAYARADQWMDWHKTTLYPAYIELAWAIIRTEPAARDPARISKYKATTERALEILDRQLGKSNYLNGDRLSMADIPFGPLIYRYLHLEIDRPRFANIEKWHAALLERPAFRKHVAFAFGRNPAEWYRLERETR